MKNSEKKEHVKLSEEYDLVFVFDMPAMYTEKRLKYVPDGFYRYEVRGKDYDWRDPATIEKQVRVNFCGTLLFPNELDFMGQDFISITDDGLNYTGATITSEEFLYGMAHGLDTIFGG